MNRGRRPINNTNMQVREDSIILTEGPYEFTTNTITTYFTMTVAPMSKIEGNVTLYSNLFPTQTKFLLLNSGQSYTFTSTYQITNNDTCFLSSTYIMINNCRASNLVNSTYCYPELKSSGISINLGNDSSILILNILPPADNLMIPIRGNNIKILKNPYNAFEINSGSIILSNGSKLRRDRKYVLVLEVCGFVFQPTIIYSSSYDGNFNPNMSITMREQMFN